MGSVIEKKLKVTIILSSLCGQKFSTPTVMSVYRTKHCLAARSYVTSAFIEESE